MCYVNVKNVEHVSLTCENPLIFHGYKPDHNGCENYLKPGQNKKDQKIFQLHPFLNLFLQLAAEKTDQKNGAARKLFGPSYFVTALKRYLGEMYINFSMDVIFVQNVEL